MTDTTEHFDVLIVGAGLSGIGAGYHLQQKCPGKSYVILEGRDCHRRHLGSVPLSRHPLRLATCTRWAIRSSRGPRPRRSPTGRSILNYVRETARENGIDKHIRFQPPGRSARRGRRRMRAGRWRSSAAGEGGTEPVRFTCNFLFMCSGYYKYEDGYTPEFTGARRFQGRIVHPQNWPNDLDYTGKRVVVIGSGATAVTLVPEMAKTAAHVTMLQRSPTYVVSRPAEDALANKLRAKLPAKLAYHLIRWRNVLLRHVLLPALPAQAGQGQGA